MEKFKLNFEAITNKNKLPHNEEKIEKELADIKKFFPYNYKLYGSYKTAEDFKKVERVFEAMEVIHGSMISLEQLQKLIELSFFDDLKIFNPYSRIWVDTDSATPEKFCAHWVIQNVVEINLSTKVITIKSSACQKDIDKSNEIHKNK